MQVYVLCGWLLFDRFDAAYLFGLGAMCLVHGLLRLAGGLLKWWFRARSEAPELYDGFSSFYSAARPDILQLVVTAKNCANFGLTPEQVAEIAKSDAPFKPAAPSNYTFFGRAGFDGGPRLVIAERNFPVS